MITSITLTNYPRFSNKLSLDLLAQDVALSLRQAQISGSSVLGVKVSGGGSTRSFGIYGIHFGNPNPAPVPYLYPYLLFADITSANKGGLLDGYNGEYLCLGPAATDECVQKFLISGRNKVKELCINFISNDGEPTDPNIDINRWRVDHCDVVGSLDIEFVRPNLDAKFRAVDVNGVQKNDTISNVGIVLESPYGDYVKTVVVWRTGQISVE